MEPTEIEPVEIPPVNENTLEQVTKSRADSDMPPSGLSKDHALQSVQPEFVAETLEVPTFLKDVVNYLQKNEPKLWQWHAKQHESEQSIEETRLALLQHTYRLSADSHAHVYASAWKIASLLDIEADITLYQAQAHLHGAENHANASLFFMPNEVHVVFYGTVLNDFSADEVGCILAHELCHYRLNTLAQGDYRIANELLQSLDGVADHNSYHETARLCHLFTEIYCDRGALCVYRDIALSVNVLVKVTTGLQQVDAASYIVQSAEVVKKLSDKGKSGAKNISHPEMHLRVGVMNTWYEQVVAPAQDVPLTEKKDKTDTKPAEKVIQQLILGEANLEQLNVLARADQAMLTKAFLQYFLQPKWVQTPLVMAHARLFFHDLDVSKQRQSAHLFRDEAAFLATCQEHKSVCDMLYSYMLLDFATVDAEISDAMLAHATRWATKLDMLAAFEKVAVKEVKNITKKLFARIVAEADAVIAEVETHQA